MSSIPMEVASSSDSMSQLLFGFICVACAVWWLWLNVLRIPGGKPAIAKSHHTRKAFSANADDGTLADHGKVRARLWIHPKTHQVTNNPTSPSCLAFDIWYGSGASLYSAEKGINDAWRYLSDEKVRALSCAFTQDAICAYNALWRYIFPGLTPPHFNPLKPDTHKTVHKELVAFIKANSPYAPTPDSTLVQSALKTYVDKLVDITRNHLGDEKAFEVQNRVNGDRRWSTPADGKEKKFLTICTQNVYRKPAVLLRDFSSLIGWQPQGGFVIDPSSPYLTRQGTAEAVHACVPPPGEGVLLLAEGLDPAQLGIGPGMLEYSDVDEKNDPCSVHWNSHPVPGCTPSGNPSTSQQCQVLECKIKWVGNELTDALIADGSTHSRDELLGLIKDPYVIQLKLQIGSASEEPVEIRCGNVHFCSGGNTDARTVAVPALIMLSTLYNLHALGGDTNITASKEPNQRDVSYLMSALEHHVPSANISVFPHAISKTRPAGDMLTNAQFLNKYGEIVERDGMIALAF
jgi:hypothetical protein